MKAIYVLIGMVLHVAASAVVLRRFGLYTKSVKPGGDRSRGLFKPWEVAALVVVELVWLALVFCFMFFTYFGSVANGMTAFLLAFGLTWITPIIAPPFVYTGVMFMLLRENHKRKRALKASEEQAGKNPGL